MSDATQWAAAAGVTLASVLALRPLDRVEIVARGDRAELALMGDPKRPGERVWLFFQRLRDGGQLELCGPGGAAMNVDPSRVASVVAGTPVRVQAAPQAERRGLAAPAAGGAWVRYVSRDPWGHLDEVHVTFDDPELQALAGDRPARLSPAERAGLERWATRRHMPVVSRTRAAIGATPTSAMQREDDRARRDVAAFFAAALAGERVRAASLAHAGAAGA